LAAHVKLVGNPPATSKKKRIPEGLRLIHTKGGGWRRQRRKYYEKQTIEASMGELFQKVLCIARFFYTPIKNILILSVSHFMVHAINSLKPPISGR
jgi:hypothetical protein